MVENEVVILGSYKPKNWEKMLGAINYYESFGIKVLSPRGKKLISFPLADNQDFYYLEADLELAGLKESDLIGKSTLDIIGVLDLRKLQGRICGLMQTKPLVHAVIEEGKVGKSVACELAVAVAHDCQIVLSDDVSRISSEVPENIRGFLKSTLVDKRYNFENVTGIIETAEEILLRPKFGIYERPKKEWMEF